MNVPNQLSIARIALAFLFMIAFMRQTLVSNWLALFIFVLASLTDMVDGHLARKYRQITNLGKLIDPLADKILMAAAFISFVELSLVPGWMVMVIIAREFCVTGLRLIASAKGRILAASNWGKQKTVSQFVVVIFVLLGLCFLQQLAALGYEDYVLIWSTRIFWGIKIGMWLTLSLTLLSGFFYIYDNRDVLADE